MSVEVFWENINSSEFLEEKFEFVKELCADFTDDVKDIVEQAEELVCDGFREILVRGNLGYHSSVELRKHTKNRLNEARKRLRAARGIDKKSMPVFLVLKDGLNAMADELENNASPLLEEIRDELKREFELILFGSPDEMRKLQAGISAIYELPESPAYDPPLRDEDINFLGSFPMSISNKKARKAAAVKYMKDAKDYEHTLAELAKSEQKNVPFFNIDAVSEDIREIIVDFDRRRRRVFHFGYGIDLNPDLHEDGKKSDGEDMAINQLKLMLIFAGGIYTAGKYAILRDFTRDPEFYARLTDEYIRLAGMATLLMKDSKKSIFDLD